MSSTVACIGFTDPGALATIVREKGEPFHELSSTSKWVDDSGAMLLLDRAAQYARPGFVTAVRTPYKRVEALDGGLARIFLTDASGYEIEPFTVVPDARYTAGWAPIGRLALVAMGIDIEFFPTAEDFFDSPRSALPGFDSEPPPEVRQFGLPWPPPMEIETFIPSEKKNEALATLSGTVQFAEVKRNGETGHEFLVTRVATVCGEVDLCSPLPLDGAPEPGSVVVGQVELLATFPPHGVTDSSSYEPPEEKVNPTFRDGEPEDFVPQTEFKDEDLGDGLILGSDGAVRTTEEHAAWKRGEEDPNAPVASADGESAETGPAQEVEASPNPEPAGATGTDAETAADSQATQHESDVDDSMPRPGETRRQWRERTGRA